MKKTFLFSIALTILLFTACSNQDNGCADQPDISNIDINIEIEQLQNDLLDVKGKDQLRAFIKENPIITQVFLKPGMYPSEEVMIDALFERFTNPHIDTLLTEVNRVFGDISELQNELTRAYKHLKYYYPDTQIPKVKTVATGFTHDMYISDTLIIISLDYYLGKEAKYRPQGMFNYMLRRYSPEYIVPSIMLLEGISPKHNKTDLKDETLLSEMVTYGKSFYFAKNMMPCVADSILVWYNTKEMNGVANNEDVIWAHFVEKGLLFETNHMVKKKYIEPRPNTFEIGEDAPGRIGTWLGWQFVNEYMENEDVTLQELMNNSDANDIFNKSKYRPSKK